MNRCVNCGCECTDVLCAKCSSTVNKEKLCREISIYDPKTCTNTIWNSIAKQYQSPYNFRNLAIEIAQELSSPRKEYMTFVCMLVGKDYVAKNNRQWLYDNYDFLIGSTISSDEKKAVFLAQFYTYFYDYRYEEAEKSAETLYNRQDLNPAEVYALADFYVKTRRYSRADSLIKKCLNTCSDKVYQAQLKVLLDNSHKRQIGKENGGMVEYIPAEQENRIRYINFMKTIGKDVTMPEQYDSPVRRIEKSTKGTSKREPIAKEDYPQLPVYSKAGFKSFVAYDIETTGFSPATESIIEIGAIKVIDGVVSETQEFIFQTFVHPYKKSVSSKITGITGITNEMVKGAPEMWDVFDDFADFIGDNILIGYNNNRFDDRFIERAGRYANRIISNKSFDVMNYARNFQNILDCEKLKLGMVSEALNIVNPRAHRALADAVTTARVYLKLLEMDNNPRYSPEDITLPKEKKISAPITKHEHKKQNNSAVPISNTDVSSYTNDITSEITSPRQAVQMTDNSSTVSLLKRTKFFLEYKEWDRAAEYSERVLDIAPECSEAYIYALLAEFKCSDIDSLASKVDSDALKKSRNYKYVLRFDNTGISEKITISAYLKRAKDLLRSNEWDKAAECCNNILNIAPECSKAYIYALYAEYKCHDIDSLANNVDYNDIKNSRNYEQISEPV